MGLVVGISALFVGVAACGSSRSSDHTGEGSSGSGGDAGGTGGDTAARSGAGGSASGNGGAGGNTPLGGAGVGGAGEGGTSVGGAGEGGSSMGGAAARSGAGMGGMGALGTGGTLPPCNPWPIPMNDPACPSPGTVVGGYYESPCTPELSCEFLVPTGDPCYQPPILQRFECCEWGFQVPSCPSLPPEHDPRCVLPIRQGTTCDVEGLLCDVVNYEGGPTTGFICCDGAFRMASSC